VTGSCRFADLGLTLGDATGLLGSGREMVADGDRGRRPAGGRMYTDMPMSGRASSTHLPMSARFDSRSESVMVRLPGET
jgi:hypothetical protein